jgi:catechol 2,3-dioxygenase-like lactoylglutathione lyase family enzyme
MPNLKPRLEKLILDVKVNNLERAISFYSDVLGLLIIKKADDWASFEAQGAEIHLYLHGGVKSGFEFRVSDINREIELLKARGVSFYADEQIPNLKQITDKFIMHFSWGKATFFKDTEGNELALVED